MKTKTLVAPKLWRRRMIKMDESVEEKIDSFVDKNNHSFGGNK
jgi:hypothetical protein